MRRWAGEGRLAKWAGYVDQYLLFPRALRRAMRHDAAGTLYVFCDQALGPWLPAVLPRPHVVHCHDLLALRSALGDIAEHATSPTGRVYQRYIRRGFRRARHFISISERSRDDLHRHGGRRAGDLRGRLQRPEPALPSAADRGGEGDAASPRHRRR